MTKFYVVSTIVFLVLFGLLPKGVYADTLVSAPRGELFEQKEPKGFLFKKRITKIRKPLSKPLSIILGILMILLGLFFVGNSLILFALYGYIYPPEVFLLIVGIIVLCIAVVCFIVAIKLFRKRKRKLVF